CFCFSRRSRHTRFSRDWSSDVCSSDLSCSARPGSFRAGGGSGSLAKGPSSAWVGLPPLAQAARASSSIGTVRRGILDMGGSLGGAGSLAQPEAGLPAGGRLETEQQRYVTEHPLCCGGE